MGVQTCTKCIKVRSFLVVSSGILNLLIIASLGGLFGQVLLLLQFIAFSYLLSSVQWGQHLEILPLGTLDASQSGNVFIFHSQFTLQQTKLFWTQLFKFCVRGTRFNPINNGLLNCPCGPCAARSYEQFVAYLRSGNAQACWWCFWRRSWIVVVVVSVASDHPFVIDTMV